MAELLDHMDLLLRALHHMPGLQFLLLGVGALLSGIALGQVARRFRLQPAIRLRLRRVRAATTRRLPAPGRARRRVVQRLRTVIDR